MLNEITKVSSHDFEAIVETNRLKRDLYLARLRK
ncbi:hypothetical protein DYY66_2532 [Candidatus Nitrosotalea sp. FS]|nr:hypothetical protein [Candidatus Nitrosotalea sp. FS]